MSGTSTREQGQRAGQAVPGEQQSSERCSGSLPRDVLEAEYTAAEGTLAAVARGGVALPCPRSTPEMKTELDEVPGICDPSVNELHRRERLKDIQSSTAFQEWSSSSPDLQAYVTSWTAERVKEDPKRSLVGELRLATEQMANWGMGDLRDEANALVCSWNKTGDGARAAGPRASPRAKPRAR